MRRLIVAGSLLCLLVAVGRAFGAGPTLVPQEIPAYGVALQVPAGWQKGQISPTSAVTHLAAAYRAPAAFAGFHTNLNLLIGQLGAGETLRQWVLGADTARYLRLGKLQSVTVHGVPGLRYESTRLVTIPGHKLLTLEYAFARGARVYLFTYSALAGEKQTFEPTFDASAATIQFAP